MNKPAQNLLHSARLVGILLVVVTFPAASQEISIGNTSRYVGHDRWDWTVFIKAPSQTLKEIRCVEYKLHPTFPNPKRKVCALGDPKFPFALSSNGWGTFEIPVKVIFKNGQTRSLKHDLRFEQSLIKKELPIKAANTAKKVRSDWWNWTVFIQGSDEALNQIQCVEYTLHRTFPNPVREVCDRGAGPAFSLSASGWGTFRIRIRVFLKDGAIQELMHDLKFE